jgi:GWxTD domain-containing protein
VVKERMLNQDIAYIYDPSQTIIKKKVYYNKDSIQLILSFADPYDHLNSKDFLNRYSFFYKIKEDYSSTDAIITDSIRFTDKDIITDSHIHYLSYSFKNPRQFNSLMILERFDKKRKIVDLIDIPLAKDSGSVKNNYLVIRHTSNIPVLDNFLLKNDTVYFKTMDDQKRTLKVFLYDQTLPPASPPSLETTAKDISLLKPEFNSDLQTGDPICFKKTGLYYLSPSADITGFSFIVPDNKFPRVVKPEEMIEPLSYITTEKEYRNLKNSVHPKLTLDSFWLAIGGSHEYSKKLIKSFYQKVEYANRSFTSYKEGWKTDRGMLYITFGKPDEVYRHNNLEEWTYENVSNNSITFNFIKKNNIYSNDDDYELVRKESYGFYWTETIEKWRKGNIIK